MVDFKNGVNNINRCVKAPQGPQPVEKMEDVQEPQVVEQMHILDGNLNDIQKSLQELEVRLSSILQNYEEEEKISMGGGKYLVPLAEGLCLYNRTAREILNKIEYIINRLEI